MSQRFSKKVSDALLAKLRAGEKLTGGEKLNLIVQLSIPSILAQVTTVLMFYIDASMVGSLGAEASASIGLVEPATWLFGSLVGSVSMGFSVQAAHFIGANDFTRARAVMRHGYAFGLLIGLLLMAIAALIAFPLPSWLGGGADIQHGASMYFLIFSFAVPVHLIEHLSASIFPTRTLSVFGHEMTVWGLGLGVEGAALGTLMAFVAAAIPLFYFAVFRSKILAWRQDVERFTWCWDYIRHACGLGAPMAFQYLLMNGAQVVSTTIVAPLGNIAIAANSFAITAESLCYMPGYGIGDAATTLIGQSVGARRADLCRSFAKMTVTTGMIVMALMGVVMYVFAPEMIGLLSPVDEIRTLGTEVLRIEAFAEPFFAAAIVSYSVCVGAGDTLRPSIINLGSMWFVRLTLAAAMAPHFGLRGVWVAMAIELTVRGLLFLWRIARGKWLKMD